MSIRDNVLELLRIRAAKTGADIRLCQRITEVVNNLPESVEINLSAVSAEDELVRMAIMRIVDDIHNTPDDLDDYFDQEVRDSLINGAMKIYACRDTAWTRSKRAKYKPSRR